MGGGWSCVGAAGVVGPWAGEARLALGLGFGSAGWGLAAGLGHGLPLLGYSSRH